LLSLSQVDNEDDGGFVSEDEDELSDTEVGWEDRASIGRIGHQLAE